MASSKSSSKSPGKGGEQKAPNSKQGKTPKTESTIHNIKISLESTTPNVQNTSIFINEMVPNSGEPAYRHQVIIQLRTTFLKVTNINTLKHRFDAEVFILAKWEELSLLGKPQEELQNIEPEELWDPQLVILNTIKELETERRSHVIQYEDGYEGPVVHFRWRFRGTFKENLELYFFPFDVQELTIKVMSERGLDEVLLIHDPRYLSAVNTKAFQESQEWSIYKHVEYVSETVATEYISSKVHSLMMFHCRVRRKVGYFMWNIVFIVILILILVFATCAIDPVLSDRLGASITLFLTLVAFKLVIKQSLPTLSYLTYVDIYVLCALIFVSMYTVENAAVLALSHSMRNKELLRVYDEIAVVFFGAMVVLLHIFLFFHIQSTALKRRRSMKTKDLEYEILVQENRRKQTSKHMNTAWPSQK